MKKILVIGSSNTDLIIVVPEIPRPGETILGGQFQTFPGGKGANQAVAAARAGGNVIFIASVGDDAYGQEAIQGYELENINIESAKICKNTPSGIAMITISEKGENAITVAPGANSKLLPKDMNEAKELFREADYMLIQLEIPINTVKRALELCAEYNTKAILNPAPAADLPDEILALTDIITPNETETEKLTGILIENENDAREAAEVLHKRGINTVIITMGAQGAFLSDMATNTHVLIKGFNVDVIDTTAAGDVFNGQLAVAMSEGEILQESVLLAHCAAALSVQKMGAQSSIPNHEDINNFRMKNIK